ncbi:tRNA (adenine(37)-N6)-methyltransferase-like isoform X2 [Acanthaster planci]|nr:tRNA (adenine(37)-N6)-methyltransferase-like isoform X2 [Acanthaster planci]
MNFMASTQSGSASQMDCKAEAKEAELMKLSGSPIGFIQSCFKSKNGTPRQPSVCAFSRAKLRVLKEVFPNPEHSIQGLAEFSHVWILFIFHKNGDRKFTKAKVKPPRLDGDKVGVFATRSPHRPNPIGLTLAKLDRIEGNTLHLSGVDIIDGTPVLDIKPYVPSYDNPDRIHHHQTPSLNPCHVLDFTDLGPSDPMLRDNRDTSDAACSVNEKKVSRENLVSVLNQKSTCHPNDTLLRSQSRATESKVTLDSHAQRHASDLQHVETAGGSLLGERSDECSQSSQVGVADWINSPPITSLEVRFTTHAETELEKFQKDSSDPSYCLELLLDQQEAKQAICNILEADPRSTYRRNNCKDRLYFFTVDTLHITCWFGVNFVEVVRIQPVKFADDL